MVFISLPMMGLLGLSLARSPQDRPNIVMLFVDDLGYGDLGFTGHPTTSTPNLDRLAYGGKVMTSWYSGAAVCTASRTALLTGRQPPRVGMPGVMNSLSAAGLPLNESTVANYLQDAGYKASSCFKRTPLSVSPQFGNRRWLWASGTRANSRPTCLTPAASTPSSASRSAWTTAPASCRRARPTPRWTSGQTQSSSAAKGGGWP
jgi:arylsulfatase A-like enzyme